MAYVYLHKKKSDDELFYVGISKSNDDLYTRANDIRKRSDFWKRLVKKYGFYVEIYKSNISWEEAKKIEIKLIKKHGRINLKTGILCNLTDGGEGCIGFEITDAYREKLSKASKGKGKRFGKENHFYGKTHTKETRNKISEALLKSDKNKGINNANYGKKMSDEQKQKLSIAHKGKKLSKEHKRKISEGGKGILKSEQWKEKRRGENNFFFGKSELLSGENNPRAKKCIFIETGEIFECLKTACKIKKMSYDTQRAYINPNHKRHSNRKFNYL